MDEILVLKYFLGANTAQGFYSLFDSFASLDKGDFLWIIKGGAGCGKSSFMKMLGAAAERSGHVVEYAYCSGDPSSLDGVYIPALHCAYVDGTAPHVMDAHIAAVDSGYLDLGAFYDIPGVTCYGNELRRLKAEIASGYKRAYALLGAAGKIRRDWVSTYISAENLTHAKKRISGIVNRNIPKNKDATAIVKSLFLSSLCCNGIVCFPETLSSLCKKLFILSDSLGLSSQMLSEISEFGKKAGHELILCQDPLCPELLEAVLFPGLSLGFVCGASSLSKNLKGRHIKLDAGFERLRLKELAPGLKNCRRLSNALITEGIISLSKIKSLHDEIESIYNPNVNFDGVYSMVATHIAQLGLK